ncbi:plasmid partitioning protein RepB [Sinorhizobium meliloti]|uniref:plasmid partitioning protein RepB n=1 Tax=Rhizobium meliloti TaxID=382 RepID=UPI000FD8D3ED|nr:plasmid partitioning protein RepB [Sinorhizobium meliloti]RVK16933.1 plasmid partitioning protein RepB [Sinorhizobium meliloti]
MSRRNTLKGIFGDAVEELAMANFEEEKEAERGPAGPVRSMALTLGKMEEEARAMQEALIAGLRVQDLDPELIDDSFVRDRIGEVALTENDPFVQSIAGSGQEVPILVRPHPEREGRYQVAYGHRRLRAARILGIPVKAVVKQIADDELVVAQGVENTARSNLTYIEKAMFAHTLEERGFKRTVIMKALTTDKTELSKMISVASSIPAPVVAQIGNTPSYGRRKWIAFAEAYSEKKLSKLEALFGSEVFSGADSDKRFDLALGQLLGKAAKPTAKTWRPREGKALTGSIKADGKTYTLALKADEAPAFGEFLTNKLDELYAEFKRTGD